MRLFGTALLLVSLAAPGLALPAPAAPAKAVVQVPADLVSQLTAKYGKAQAVRIERGLRQVQALWLYT